MQSQIDEPAWCGPNFMTELRTLQDEIEYFNRRHGTSYFLSRPKREKLPGKVIGYESGHNLYEVHARYILHRAQREFTRPEDITRTRAIRYLIDFGEKESTARLLGPFYLPYIRNEEYREMLEGSDG